MTEENHERRIKQLEDHEQAPQPFYGHALSWPARASITLMLVVLAFLLTRVLTEGSRTKHIAQGAAANAVSAQAKSNKNAVTLNEVQDQINRFGRIFCGQQDAFRGLPTSFATPSTAAGQALVGSIIKIQKSGEIVYIQLKCPNPPAAGATPSPSPGG